MPMIVTKHAKERFAQRYRLFFYDFQLSNLDKFIPELISTKCSEIVNWKSNPFKCNQKKLRPSKDKVFRYKGKHKDIYFIVKEDRVITCFDKF